MLDCSVIQQKNQNPENISAAAQVDSKAFRADRFAEKRVLSQWFPQINNDEKSSWRIWFSRRSQALLVPIFLVGAIFVTNVSFTAFGASHYRSQKGVGLIYQGDCGTLNNLDRWLHLLINILSTGMLSASNYCMQLQAAPTRRDVDHAHRDNQWLDIGVPSLRNLKRISGWRLSTWVLLGLSSIPIHLLYNFDVFQSLESNDYVIAVVRDSFLNGTAFNLTTAEHRRRGDWGWDDYRVNPPEWNYTNIIDSMQQAAMKNSFETMNVSDCFYLYEDYWRPQQNAVILVKNQSEQVPSDAGSVLMYVGIVPRLDNWAKNMWALGDGTGSFVALQPSDPVTTWHLGPPSYEVSHCLVQSPGESNNRCRFEYSPPIMITPS